MSLYILGSTGNIDLELDENDNVNTVVTHKHPYEQTVSSQVFTTSGNLPCTMGRLHAIDVTAAPVNSKIAVYDYINANLPYYESGMSTFNPQVILATFSATTGAINLFGSLFNFSCHIGIASGAECVVYYTPIE